MSEQQFLYTNIHPFPVGMHVHIYCSNGEAKFWLEPEIELARNHGISRKQLKKIEKNY